MAELSTSRLHRAWRRLATLTQAFGGRDDQRQFWQTTTRGGRLTEAGKQPGTQPLHTPAHIRRMPAAAVVHILLTMFLPHLLPLQPPIVVDLNAAALLGARLQINVLGVSCCIAAGYSLFVVFFSREGSRYYALHTELSLARAIHRELVPSISRQIGDYEFRGVSIPSGDVGGDLVDLVDHDEGTCRSSAGEPPPARWRSLSWPRCPLASCRGGPSRPAVPAVRPATSCWSAPDGLTDVFNAADEEFGMELVHAVLAMHATAPLAEIELKLLAAARAHGTPHDDQSLILVRRTA